MDVERPDDWNWVEATDNCTAQVMFGRLRQLAQRNVEDRNRQLGGEDRFRLTDVSDLQFSVGPTRGSQRTILFKINNHNLIEVSGLNAISKVTYAVRLDSRGVCRFRQQDGGSLDAWQLLQAALESLLFD